MIGRRKPKEPNLLAELRAQLVMPDGHLFGDVLAPFQRRDFGELDNGKHRHAYLERPRGHSKTSDIAAEAVCELFLGPKGGRLFAAAVDRDQAGILHEAASGWIRRTPMLADHAEIERYKITVPEQDTTLTILSADAPSAYGLMPTWICCDELAEWPERAGEELWNALWSAVPKRKARMLVISMAGWDRTSLAWRIRSLAESERDWYFKSAGQEASWIDPAELAAQRRSLPPHVYARLHEGRWVEGAGAFLTVADVDPIFDRNLKPQAQRVGDARHVIGLDLGLTKDRSVAAVVHRDRKTGHVTVDALRTWSGTKAEPVDLPEVEETVRALARVFRAEVVLDPYQAVLLAQRLRGQSVRVTEFPFTGDSRRRLFGALFQLVKDRHLHCFPHADLRKELLTLEVTNTAAGWRVDHKTGRHDDHAIAVALAARHAATENPGLSEKAMRGLQSLVSGGGGWGYGFGVPELPPGVKGLDGRIRIS